MVKLYKLFPVILLLLSYSSYSMDKPEENSIGMEFCEIKWEGRNGGDLMVSQSFPKDIAELVAKALKSELAEERQSGVRVHESSLSIGQYRVIIDAPLFNSSLFQKTLGKKANGKKYYEDFIFNKLSHATSCKNLINILTNGSILARDKLEINSIDRPLGAGTCKDNVVYTMLMPDYLIYPRHEDVIIELPLELLERDDWYINDAWDYGQNYTNTLVANSLSIMQKKHKLLFENCAFENNSREKIFSMYSLVMYGYDHEVCFRNPISFSKLDAGETVRLYFKSAALMQNFIAEMDENKVSLDWMLSSTHNEGGVRSLVLKRK